MFEDAATGGEAGAKRGGTCGGGHLVPGALLRGFELALDLAGAVVAVLLEPLLEVRDRLLVPAEPVQRRADLEQREAARRQLLRVAARLERLLGERQPPS